MGNTNAEGVSFIIISTLHYKVLCLNWVYTKTFDSRSYKNIFVEHYYNG